jgi:hypothetical protein
MTSAKAISLEHHDDERGDFYALCIGTRVLIVGKDGQIEHVQTGYNLTMLECSGIGQFARPCLDCTRDGVEPWGRYGEPNSIEED